MNSPIIDLYRTATAFATIGNYHASQPKKRTPEDTRLVLVDFENESFILLCRKPYEVFKTFNGVKSVEYL